MSARFRLDTPHETGFRRYTIGVLVSSACKEIAAVAVEAVHQASTPPAVGEVRGARVPEELTGLFGQLSAASSCPLALLTTLRTQLTELEASLVCELLGELSLPAASVLAVGIHDPGIWTCAPTSSAPVGFLGLCDPARLAEITGLCVVDAFPCRDLAAGGQGGPITAIAEWLLLRDARHTRVLLDLGQTARITYLPAMSVPNAAARVLAFEVGPGTRLLDALTQRLTAGQNKFDPGGRLAVQGKQIPELLEHWLRDPYFERPLPRWNPRGVRPERFLMDSMQMAIDAGWTVRDLLCTATHFVADAVTSAIRRRLPDDLPLDQIVVTGGGQHNGMLLREIGARLPRLPIVRLADLGIAPEAFGPATIGLLAALQLDQTPGNSTAITGADTPRVLGRLTPGSPQHWQQLLVTIAGNPTAVRPLRSAIA
jgi:anhydro-N-acetylmuramic acid kinase